MSRHPPGKRADYCWFNTITTRWIDNDVFRHVNNVNYFAYFDTAVTYYEMSEKVVGLLDGPVHCVVAEVACRYYSSLAFPDRVTVGIRVASIGRSSVRYEVGIFRNDEDVAAAEGHPPRAPFLERTRGMLTTEGSPLTASMFRDITACAPVEADHVIGDLIARGDAARVPVPKLRIAYTHLMAYERQRG